MNDSIKFTCPCCNAEYEISFIPTLIPEKKVTKKPTAPRKAYGDYKHVRLLDSEHEALVAEFGAFIVDKAIKAMDDWMEAKGRRPYKDYRAALRGWIQRDIDRNPYLKEKLPMVEGEKKEFDESHWE